MQKPGLRKPRFTRSEDGFPPIHITERDIRILALVERHRFVSSRHIILMMGGSAQHITRRLGRLFHAGLLHRPRAQLWLSRNNNAHMVCCMTDMGQVILREHGLPTFASPPRARGETMALSLSHSLRVSDVMLALERSAVAAGHRFLHHEEWQAQEEPKLCQMRWNVSMNYDGRRARTAVMPDGVFAIEKDGRRSFFLIEVDRGTMPVARPDAHQSSFRRKVLAYKTTRDAGVLWKRHEIPGFRVLVTSESQRRLVSLRAAAASCFQRGDSNLFCFAVAGQLIETRRPSDHSWLSPGGAEVHPFTLSPRHGGTSPESLSSL